jgi:hypothetical protein
VHLDQIAVADDGTQNGVEIMGDAAGQYPDCLHFLGLPQLGFK